ncbi:MAG: hypothetical protein SFY70_06885 [Bacteroidia bacterium]|nr:hypothetical protein [Bacteroidia bacterium]
MHFLKLLHDYRLLATIARAYRRNFRSEYRLVVKALAKAHASLKARLAAGETLTHSELHNVFITTAFQSQIARAEKLGAPHVAKSAQDLKTEVLRADARVAAGPAGGKAATALAGLQQYHRHVEAYLGCVAEEMAVQNAWGWGAYLDAQKQVLNAFEAAGKPVPYLSPDSLSVYYNQLCAA